MSTMEHDEDCRCSSELPDVAPAHLRCTRGHGHSGPHVAHDPYSGRALYTWERSSYLPVASSDEGMVVVMFPERCLLPDHNGKACQMERGHLGYLHDGR